MRRRCSSAAWRSRRTSHSRGIPPLVLNEQHRTEEALAQIEQLLTFEPGQPVYLNLKANVPRARRRPRRGDRGFEAVLADTVEPAHRMTYGDAPKDAAGRRTASPHTGAASGSRRASARRGGASPTSRPTRFRTADLRGHAGPARALGRHGRRRLHLHFALAKALEDAERYAESFAQYAEGTASQTVGHRL